MLFSRKSAFIQIPVHKAMIGLLGLSLMTGALSGCGQQSGTLSSIPGQGAPKAVTPEQQKQITQLMNTGNKAAASKNWASAQQSFDQVVAINPDYAPAHVQLGWINAEQKQWDNASRHLQRAIAIAPQQAAAHANLAWVNAEQGRWEDALNSASKAIDLDPKNAYAHATLAWAYQKTNQESLAISEYEKSIELKPTLDNSRFALGMAYCNQGAAPRAKEQLDWLKQHHASKASELQGRVSKGCYAPKK